MDFRARGHSEGGGFTNTAESGCQPHVCEGYRPQLASSMHFAVAAAVAAVLAAAAVSGSRELV